MTATLPAKRHAPALCKSVALSAAIMVHFAYVSPAAAQIAESYTSYPPKTGVTLGNGWDSARGVKTSARCIVADVHKDPGQHRDPEYTQVNDSSSLMDALTISAQAKVGGIQGALSGDASMKLARTTKLEMTGINIAVRILSVEGSSYLVPPGTKAQGSQTFISRLRSLGLAPTLNPQGGSILLIDKYAKLAKKNYAAFRRECGDSYVSTVNSGAGLEGVFSVSTRDYSEKTDLQGKIGGAYGPFSGSIEARQQIEKAESEGRIHIHYFQLGGDNLSNATDFASFQTLAKGIGVATPGQPGTPFELGLTPYEALPNFPTGSHQQPDLKAMVDEYYRLASLYSALDEILTTNTYFFDGAITLDRTRALQDGVRASMDSLRSAVANCANHTSCAFPTTVARSDYSVRSQLPIKKEAVRDLIALESAKLELAKVNDALNSLPSPIPVEWAPGVFELARRKQTLENEVARLTSTVNSVEDRFLFWIDSASRDRCRREEFDVCLTNAQLSAIHNQMILAH